MKIEARHDPLLGSVLEGRYRLVSLLGRGGMGSVYVAEETRLGRRYALKVLKPDLAEDRAQVERFLREAQTIARLEHPNIVDIHSFGEDPSGLVFFTMELLTGEELESRILARSTRPYSIREACNWAAQIARAVGVVHQNGLIHRDLKTQNVFLARTRDGGELVKLLDFGIARSEEGSELTRTGNVLGTPSYMSPEQVRNERLDRRSDIYSFGVLLFKLLTGRPPFVGEAIQVAMHHLTTTPPPPSSLAPSSGIPPALDELVLKAMSKKACDRHDSMEAIERALIAVQAGEEASFAGPSVVVAPPVRPAGLPHPAALASPPAPSDRPPLLPSGPAATGQTEVRQAALLVPVPVVPPPRAPATTTSRPLPPIQHEAQEVTEVRLAPLPEAVAAADSQAADDEVTAQSMTSQVVTETALAPSSTAPAAGPGPTRMPLFWHLVALGASLLALLSLAAWLVSRTNLGIAVTTAEAPKSSAAAPAGSTAAEPASTAIDGPKAPPPAPPEPADPQAKPLDSAGNAGLHSNGDVGEAVLDEQSSVDPTPPATKPPRPKTATPPLDPITRIKERARACRRKHRAAGEPAITVEYAIGSDGIVLRATASQDTPLGACLADAVKQARFEPRIRLRQEIAL